MSADYHAIIIPDNNIVLDKLRQLLDAHSTDTTEEIARYCALHNIDSYEFACLCVVKHNRQLEDAVVIDTQRTSPRFIIDYYALHCEMSVIYGIYCDCGGDSYDVYRFDQMLNVSTYLGKVSSLEDEDSIFPNTANDTIIKDRILQMEE